MKARRILPLLALVLLMPRGGARAVEPAALYAELCAGCHGEGTTRLSGSPYPALFGNPQVAAAGPIYVALKALQRTGNMYPLCALASDEEIATLANYLAAANGSQSPPLSPAGAAALRPAVGDCPVPH
ncbi:cytochrome c [uncultured Thiodictyon sp.]|uniref:c-type cytochrome n=1 Tax=uncultured Thiodictyon sp. TaxID=1846217 RepID=UPI0025E4AA28|nr:cytochrome c [uncultured Thiodictyon sp.]